jgi:RNA polymerase primary sigma factor
MGLALNITPASSSVASAGLPDIKRKPIRRKNSSVVSLFDAHRFVRLTPEDAIDKFKNAVLKWANYYIKVASGLQLEDLISAGNIGILNAIRKYRPEKMKYALSSFQSFIENSIRWEIKSEISSFVKSKEEVVRVSVGKKRKKYKNKIVRHIPEFISLDTPVGKEGDGLNLHDIIEDSNGNTAFQDILIKEMWKYIQNLEEQQRLVLTLRFKDEGKTLEQVGDILGVTKERARQIEKDAINALRAMLAI